MFRTFQIIRGACVFVFFSVVAGCQTSSPEQLMAHYGAKQIPSTTGAKTYSASVDVQSNHINLQDRLTLNAFKKVCDSPATILTKGVSKTYRKTVTQTQNAYHAPTGLIIQTASYPVQRNFNTLTYTIACDG